MKKKNSISKSKVTQIKSKKPKPSKKKGLVWVCHRFYQQIQP